MAIIGTFTKSGDGFNGSIKTLTLSAKVSFKPIELEGEKAPNFRVTAGTVEFGAAWKKTSRENRDYLSVKVDDPSFPGPIYATLVETDTAGEYALIWSR